MRSSAGRRAMRRAQVMVMVAVGAIAIHAFPPLG
jgi:hypothetical protein